MSPLTKRLRDNAICIDMYRAADVIDAQDKVKRDDESLMSLALLALEAYREQTRPIHQAAHVMDLLRSRLSTVKERSAGDDQ